MTDFDFSSAKYEDSDDDVRQMMQHLNEARDRHEEDDNWFECFRCGATACIEVTVPGDPDTYWQCKRCGFGKGNRII